MKKIFITLAALVCLSATVSAQTVLVVEETPVLTNKKGARILPQAGDIALTVSANPFFRYFGNMFNRTGTNDAPFFGTDEAVIYGKFFMRDNAALRIGVGLNFYNDYTYARNVTSNTTTGATVTDEMKYSHQAINFMLGYEWRRGFNRLQGFYGVEASIGYSRNIVGYSYGNDITTDVRNPWSWNFQSNSQAQVTSRMIREKGPAQINASLYGFVGAEYFYLPKMSIGGEVRLGVAYNNRGKSKITSEVWDNNTNRVEEFTTETSNPYAATEGFNVRTLAQGNIFLNFYF